MNFKFRSIEPHVSVLFPRQHVGPCDFSISSSTREQSPKALGSLALTTLTHKKGMAQIPFTQTQKSCSGSF